MARKIRKRKIKKSVPAGLAHIHSTFNNTIVTITDPEGNAISWSSAGALGFKGSKKSTPFAASQASEACAKAAMDAGVVKVEVLETLHLFLTMDAVHLRNLEDNPIKDNQLKYYKEDANEKIRIY